VLALVVPSSPPYWGSVKYIGGGGSCLLRVSRQTLFVGRPNAHADGSAREAGYVEGMSGVGGGDKVKCVLVLGS
jgi:hypothetical protein